MKVDETPQSIIELQEERDVEENDVIRRSGCGTRRPKIVAPLPQKHTCVEIRTVGSVLHAMSLENMSSKKGTRESLPTIELQCTRDLSSRNLD